MNSISIAVITLSILGGPHQNQGTKLSLVNDGRIIVGSSLQFLLGEVKLMRFSGTKPTFPGAENLRFGSKLANKLRSSRVKAIVVPSGPVGGAPVIGLLIGESSLPEDYPIGNADFEKLRSYSTSTELASVQKIYEDLSEAMSDGNSDKIPKIQESMKAIVMALNPKDQIASQFAGFLLSDLETVGVSADSLEYVKNYRDRVESVFDPILSSPDYKIKALGISPVSLFSGADDTKRTFGEVKSDLVYSISPNWSLHDITPVPDMKIYKFWSGRSLLIASNRPGVLPGKFSSSGAFIDFLQRTYGLGDKTTIPRVDPILPLSP